MNRSLAKILGQNLGVSSLEICSVMTVKKHILRYSITI